MNFQMTPQSLGALNQVPIDMTLQALDWQQRAQQADQMSLAELSAQQQRAAQKHAMDQKTSQLNLDTGLAQLPGIRAQAATRERDNRMGEATFDETMKAKLREFAIKATDDDLKAYDQQVQKLLNSADPTERAKGEKLSMASKEMLKAREEHRMRKELEDIKTQRSLTLATTPRPGSATNANPWSEFNKLKKATEKEAFLRSNIARLPEDDPMRETMAAMLEALVPQIERERVDAAQKAAGFERGADGKWVPVTPKPMVVLPNSPAAADRPARQAAQEAAKQYTPEDIAFTAKKYGMTEAQVKEKLGIK